MGPGIITANVDNDAGGIATYSIAGTRFGFTLIWILLPVLIALIIIQEMCSRMGIVTGKGLSDLIRENYGVKVTFYVMIALLLTNFGNILAEFSGIAASMEIFGISRYISIPVSAVAVWLLIVRWDYKKVEKVFLVACLIYIAYPLSALMAGLNWKAIAVDAATPSFSFTLPYFLMIMGIIGTTIAPWMQFYQQSAVVEKGISVKDYKLARLDVIGGSLFAVLVAFFIVIACGATLFAHGIKIETAADAAVALAPLAGKYASLLFALGLLNASLFAASILPLSTAFYVCEGMGWESGVNRNFSDAPQFFALYTVLIILGGGLILLPGAPLLQIMYLSQVVNCILLPFILIFILLLINKKKLMGEYTNGKTFNIFAWATVAILVILTILLTVSYLGVI
jgi:Mn2+/Fe2+ NRAMP family transporter